MKLPRTWVDAELSLVVPLEQKSTLLTPAQMAQALAAGTDNLTEAVVSFSDLNSVSQTVPATIDAAWSAAVISLDSTRTLIHQVSREPLTATSTGDELKARGRFLALASRLISSINGLKAAAATLSGDRAMQNAGGQHARQLREGPGGGGRIAAANRAALTATPAFALPVGHFAGGTPIQGLHLLGAVPAVTVIRNIDDDGETRTAGQVRARDILNPIPSPIRKKISGVAVAAPVQQVVAVPTVTVGGAPVPQVPQVTRKRQAPVFKGAAVVADSSQLEMSGGAMAGMSAEDSSSEEYDVDAPVCTGCSEGALKGKVLLPCVKDNCGEDNVLWCSRKQCTSQGICRNCRESRKDSSTKYT